LNSAFHSTFEESDELCIFTYTQREREREREREKDLERFEIVASQILILTHSETIHG
jgi:hypothetical protein